MKKFDQFLDRHAHRISIFFPLFAGLALLILSLGSVSRSVTLPESYAGYIARGSFADIFSLMLGSGRAPLFPVLLKIWGNIFGTSVISLRFHQIFMAFAALVFIFQFIKRWFGMRPALAATTLVAFSPALFRGAVSISSSTLSLTFLSILLCFAQSLASRKSLKNSASKAEKCLRLAAWSFFVLISALAIITDFKNTAYVALIFVFALIAPKIDYGRSKRIELIFSLFLLGLIQFFVIELIDQNGIKPWYLTIDRTRLFLPIIFLTLFAAVAAVKLDLFIKKKRLVVSIAAAILVAVSALNIVGLVYEKTHLEKTGIAASLAAVIRLSDPGEPFLAADQYIYYDAIFYDYTGHAASLALSDIDLSDPRSDAVYKYRINIVDSVPVADKFWYIAPAGEHRSDLAYSAALEQKFSGFKVSRSVNDEDYLCYELARTAEK